MNEDGENVFDFVAPTYGAECFDAVYAYQGYDADGNELSYDPAAEAEYIAAGNLIAAANAGWGNPVGDFGYPFVTATLFSAYYGPNNDSSYVEGSPDGGVSSLPIAGS